jgi:hypothetical protein
MARGLQTWPISFLIRTNEPQTLSARAPRCYEVEPSRSGLFAKPSKNALQQLRDTLTPDAGLV